ncbi:hypothetical protein BJ165DRAFT_767789 [Panaeolus papilionaceus]|nr:hypothetical protein BJ165DRAFT_767789 [Panaeolus papilionaceus]
MAQVKVPNDGLVLPETRERIDQGIENLIQYLKGELSLSSTDAELQSWIQRVLDQFPKRDPVGTSAKIDKALERRKYQPLYICFWCENTFTTANGLGNHLRSHLKFHMSFCHHPDCNFRSVTPTLPKRHLEIRHGLKRVPGQEKTGPLAIPLEGGSQIPNFCPDEISHEPTLGPDEILHEPALRLDEILHEPTLRLDEILHEPTLCRDKILLEQTLEIFLETFVRTKHQALSNFQNFFRNPGSVGHVQAP